MIECGNSPQGEHNPNSKYTTQEIYNLRYRVYIQQERPQEVFYDYEEMGRSYFYKVLHGDNRVEPGSGVELIYALRSVGQANSRTVLSNIEVLSIRNRIHIDKEPQLQVFQEYKERISWDAFIKLVRGETWKSVDCSMIGEIKIERKGKPKAKISEEEVAIIRYRHEVLGEDVTTIFLDYSDKVTRKTIQRIVRYETWKNVKPVSTIPEA